MILVIGSLLGFISVAFGAYAEHSLQKNITDAYFQSITTAIRYNQLYAIIISAIGLALLSNINNQLLKWTGYTFISGIILFSFSIYLGVLLNIHSFMKITPIGGTTLMLGWILLFITGLRKIPT